jgi:signal transduction histidine kinase
MAEETVRRAVDISDKHSISLTSSGPLPVEADRELLSLVLIRLLENAVAASPDGGPIEASARREAGQAVVSVADHGPGIPVERRPHIFEPFYEPVPSGLPGYVGVVSLRLHLCKRIVEGHGGTMSLASGQGSTFSFSLPLSDPG